MTSRDILSDLFRHMEWADAAVWKAVHAHAQAVRDERILSVLYHHHITQHVFHRTWLGEPRDTPYPEFTEAGPMMEWAKGWFREAFSTLEGFTDDAIGATLDIPWAHLIERRLGRPAAGTTVGETVLQVAMHSLYHLGQVNARLKELGGEPPLIDYIAWVWRGRPPASWPSLTPTVPAGRPGDRRSRR